jgi:hypothetical protein
VIGGTVRCAECARRQKRKKNPPDLRSHGGGRKYCSRPRLQR